MNSMRLCFIAIFIFQLVYGGLFYEGNIAVRSINATIIANNSNATANVQYVIANLGDDLEEVNLSASDQYNSLQQSVIIEPGHEKRVNVSYIFPVLGENTKTLSYNPLLKINGKLSPKRVEKYNVMVILPETVQSVAASNKEPSFIRAIGNRTYYYWSLYDIYPTTIMVK